jgi:hypothetical protein
MRTPLKGHRREYIKSMKHAGNTYSYSVKCECGWSEFLNNSKRRFIEEAHRMHKQHVVWLAGHCAECGTEIDNGPGLCEPCELIEPSIHEIVTGTGSPLNTASLEMWQDLLPGVGVCRYCGIAPGPVCSAYACVMREGEDDQRSDRVALGEDDEYDGQWYGLDKLDADPQEGE